MRVRTETEEDARAIRKVNEEAFGGADEADIIAALRDNGAVTLSCVAEDDGKVVGHILFSPVVIVCERSTVDAIALGPMAVLPPYQRRGIGTRLVTHGLDSLRKAGHGIVVVLGHPEYYPRFGFVPANRLGITCQFDAPDEAFMALELRRGAWQGERGEVRYRPEFGAA